MSNFGFLGYPSTSLSQTSSSSSSHVGFPLFEFGQPSNSSSNNSSVTPLFGTLQTMNANCSNPFAGNSTGAFGTTSSAPSPVSTLSPFGGAVHQSANLCGFSFSSNAAQAGVNSPFPSVHSDPFSAQTQNSGVTTAFSPFSSQSNANSPFPSVHSNPFSTRNQSSGATKFSPFSTKSNANSLFPSRNSNASFTFSPVNPNLSTQTHQSNSATGFAQFSSHSNTNSPFPSVCFGQTQSSGVTGFAPFSSQSNAYSYISNYSNSFTPQTQSFNSLVTAGFSTNNTSTPFFNSTQSTTPISTPVISPSSGSRATPYYSTKEPEGNFHSISSMPVYKSKSHEELRFEDYQLCIKDGQSATTQAQIGVQTTTIPISAPVISPSSRSGVTPYASTKELEGNFLSISSMPVYKNKSHEELRFEDYSLCNKDGQSATKQAENGIPLNSFCPSVFPPVKPTCTNIFPSFISPVNTQSMPPNTTFLQKSFFSPPFTCRSITTPSISTSVTTALFTPSTSATTQENIFAPKCSSSAFDLPNSPNIVPSLSSFVPNTSLSQVTTPRSTLCSNCNRIETQSSQPTLVGTSTNLSPDQLNPSNIQQTVQRLGKDVDSIPQFQSSVEPDAVQVSSSHPGSVISVQYGISSLSVSDKAAPTRRRSLLIVRHSSLNRAKMLPPRYNLDSNASRVPFFMAGKEKAIEGAAKTKSVIFARENPRSWICLQTKEYPQSYNSNTLPEMEHSSINVYENGDIVVELSAPASSSSLHLDTNILDGNVTEAHLAEEKKQTNTCEAVNYKHGIDVDDIMPKLKNDDYYTVPTIQELAAKEKEEPGFCRRVKDFVIGRRGFGAIKFTGETDVQGLELDALVQFNYHEVIVYMDDSKKPDVGKGLNKPAEVALLNLKCINKKTGEEYKDGPLVDKYKNLLIRKSAEQGAEFVSYDPVKGEWKFKVNHF